MTKEGRTNSDLMSIRAWLRLAALGLIALAGMSCFAFYQMAGEVQSYAEQLRRNSHYQTVNAALARDVTRAWLNVESGDPALFPAALAELEKHRKVVQGIVDETGVSPGTISPAHHLQDRTHWLQVHSGLGELIKVAQAAGVRLKATSTGKEGPASVSLADRMVFRQFVDSLGAHIATSRFAGMQSHSGVHFVLEHLCLASLAMTGAMIAYGLFFFLFISHRIRTRTSEVVQRLLQYSSNAPSNSNPPPQGDEFGTIEAQIDLCAQTVYTRQMEVEKAHRLTMRQLEKRTQELAKLNDALRASGRALVRFLTDVSHDLRTPLAIMVGESEVSLRSKSTSISEYKETLSKMLEQTRYLGSLVDQLLYTARSRVSAVPLEPEYVEIGELVRLACRDMQTLADGREVLIEFTGLNDRQVVLGDRTRLREMMLTILDNAIEYSKPHTAIAVSIARHATNLKVEVADQGIGIPAREMPMIFRRFYRAENSSEANVKGTGIGLAVAKGIVESHNGTIEISSEEGQGTTVTLILPLANKTTLESESEHALPGTIAEPADV